MKFTTPIDGMLEQIRVKIEQHAIDYGLDFFDVQFEICDYDTINILAAQGGFPSRYPHWRFGMEYDQLSKKYAYGLQKIYEMVVNTDPCYAYLLKGNHIVDQKIVMAHVYGHADFFKNNYWFSNTNRKIMDVMANNGTKIRRYMDKYGQDRVEGLIDKIHSLENLIDPNVLFETADLGRRRKKLDDLANDEKAKGEDEECSTALRSFMDMKKRQSDKKVDEEKELDLAAPKLFKKTRDIMKFLADFAPIEEWESDIISMVREEAYYFLPQRLTKIMNEGWASYWHSKIMTEKSLRAQEIVDFADHHSGVMRMDPKSINPYKVGIELFRDIEYRWDTGKFGNEYQFCDNLQEKENWDKSLGLGRKKIFEVRSSHNDITFIDEFLTQEFCERNQLFTYKYNPRTGRNEISSRDFEMLKQKLLSQLTNSGQPVIEVEDANFTNRGELLLNHCYNGIDLDMQKAQDTMKNIFTIWKRPVNLKTHYDGRDVIFCFNGKELRPLS